MHNFNVFHVFFLTHDIKKLDVLIWSVIDYIVNTRHELMSAVNEHYTL